MFESLSRTVTCTRELIIIYMCYSQGEGLNTSHRYRHLNYRSKCLLNTYYTRYVIHTMYTIHDTHNTRYMIHTIHAWIPRDGSLRCRNLIIQSMETFRFAWNVVISINVNVNRQQPYDRQTGPLKRHGTSTAPNASHARALC